MLEVGCELPTTANLVYIESELGATLLVHSGALLIQRARLQYILEAKKLITRKKNFILKQKNLHGEAAIHTRILYIIYSSRRCAHATFAMFLA